MTPDWIGTVFYFIAFAASFFLGKRQQKRETQGYIEEMQRQVELVAWGMEELGIDGPDEWEAFVKKHMGEE